MLLGHSIRLLTSKTLLSPPSRYIISKSVIGGISRAQQIQCSRSLFSASVPLLQAQKADEGDRKEKEAHNTANKASVEGKSERSSQEDGEPPDAVNRSRSPNQSSPSANKDTKGKDGGKNEKAQDDFNKPPRFFWPIAGIAALSYVALLGFGTYAYIYITPGDVPRLRSDLTATIASNGVFIEKLYRFGVVNSVIKALSDPEPAKRDSAIIILQQLMPYDQITQDLAERKVTSYLMNALMYSQNQDTAAKAVAIYTQLLGNKKLHRYIIQDTAVFDVLEVVAKEHKDPAMQSFALYVITTLLSNRENHPWFKKNAKILKISEHLAHSQDSEVAANAHFVHQLVSGEKDLDRQDFPDAVKAPAPTLFDKSLINAGASIVAGGAFTYLYAWWRWNRNTHNKVLSHRKGLLGAGLTVAYLALNRMAEKAWHPYVKQKVNNNLTALKQTRQVPAYENEYARGEQTPPPTASPVAYNVAVSPAALFTLSQLKIVANAIFFYNWRHVKYVFFPSIFVEFVGSMVEQDLYGRVKEGPELRKKQKIVD